MKNKKGNLCVGMLGLVVMAVASASAHAVNVTLQYIQDSASEVRQVYGQHSQPTVYVDGRGTNCPLPAYACDARTISVGRSFMNRQESSYGDYVTKSIVAHEWGHTIQFARGTRLREPHQELQADCFAGNFDKYAESNLGYRSFIASAVRSARAAAGDRAHGTAQQRDNATRTGYQRGAQSCFSWRGFAATTAKVVLTSYNGESTAIDDGGDSDSYEEYSVSVDAVACPEWMCN